MNPEFSKEAMDNVIKFFQLLESIPLPEDYVRPNELDRRTEAVDLGNEPPGNSSKIIN